jgi:dipeptidyl aminopeptidase/acylaminoacyl peptidase
MPQPAVKHYGEWESSITADMIVGETVALGSICCDGDDLYWAELRPAEKGRTVLCHRDQSGAVSEITPPEYNVRSRVHEYGGGSYTVAEGVVFFCNGPDQALYRQDPGQAPQLLTQGGRWRYADMRVDVGRRRLIAVREDHDESLAEPANALVAISFDGSVSILAEGADFYAAPRLSPDGSQLAFLTWNHPDMPWDASWLWLADIEPDGTLEEAERIAGGASQAVFQPAWSPDGLLYYVSDPEGWWNLHRWEGKEAISVCPIAAEFGLPQWVFGMSSYGFDEAGEIVATYCEEGRWRLGRIDVMSGTLTPIETAYCDFGALNVKGSNAYFVGGHVSKPPALVVLDLGGQDVEVVRRSTDVAIDPKQISPAQAISFPTRGGEEAYGFYYPPANGNTVAPDGTLPPLIVKSHGGPTSQTGEALNLKIQYWTSRGFAVLDVNYRGSTGYGRAYRERLRGDWGVIDVEDCEAGADFLVKTRQVDGDRLIITGGSAGGYTTLCALTFCNTFKAGASHYGIGDLSTLATDTHKFESRYLDRLIGPWPSAKPLYRERSPINFANRLDCPVIFFQGLDDKVVPPNQAETMVAALKEKGTPVAYCLFEGEGHGFRQAANMKRVLEGELYFYGRIFGFTPADEIEPLAIENLS